MRVVVISNDVTPGFGVPVAAPGLRAAGIAEGLRAAGHSVTVSVPLDLAHQIFGDDIPTPPKGTCLVAPPEFMKFIDSENAEVVVFINANLTPHLQPKPSVQYVYDLFAPKMLELEASPTSTDVVLVEMSDRKARAMALADTLWINGNRKREYGLDWWAKSKPSADRATLDSRVSIVEMPVPLPPEISPERPDRSNDGSRRLGIAGYAQQWSTLPTVHPGHQLLVDSGFELHALLPGHWGGNPATVPQSALPDQAINHEGPLGFEEFARWVQSMDAMVDVFAPSPERRLAMITRSAVALRLGVPLVHAVDSEISDIVSAFDAGWVLDPDDDAAWQQVCIELGQPEVLARKTEGAVRCSHERFDPAVSLTDAGLALTETQTG